MTDSRRKGGGKRPSDAMTEALRADGYDAKPLSPILARLVDAGEAIAMNPLDRVDFLHATLCQVGLPRSKPDGDTFERTSGNASLLLQAGKLWTGRKWEAQPLPYGTRPRLALVHVCTEAVRTKSPVVDMGHSVRDFMTRLGCDPGGREFARFENQMKALAVCHMTLGVGATQMEAKPFRKFAAWLGRDGRQGTLWPGSVELSPEFFASLSEYAVPLDYRALGALQHSALALDVYTWLAHRLHRVRQIGGTKLPWAALRDQFGQEYREPKDFRKEFRAALRQVLAVYPDAKVEDVPTGVLLKPSVPPVAKTIVQGGKPGDK